MWQLRLIIVLAISASGIAVGSAAALSATARPLGAATLTVPRCTTAGLTVLHNPSVNTIVSITVSGLPAACGGAVLQAAVTDGIVIGSGTATVPASGGSVTVTLSSAPSLLAVDRTDIVLIGP
jgi:hypothetical protein